jgi:hypothetical protein
MPSFSFATAFTTAAVPGMVCARGVKSAPFSTLSLKNT